MLRQPVSSSALRSVGYDPRQHVLEVEFENRNVHWFLKVPDELYQGLLRAPSVGTFFNDQIKGKFESYWVKLTTFDVGSSAPQVTTLQADPEGP